ncbi:MAG: VCBS repeat-containing protein [Myxococcota bacterium]
MPLLAIPLALPADVSAIRAGDIDADGRDELLVVSHTAGAAGQPDAVTLTVMHFDADAHLTEQTDLALGRRATLWDVQGGLWGIDAKGVRDLQTGDRPIAQPTMMGMLGATAPLAADIADDFDGDGLPEVIVPGGGRLSVYSIDGTHHGSVPAPPNGELTTRNDSGGVVVVASAKLPPMVIGDIDGDGLKDILLPSDRRATAWITGDVAGETKRVLPLPLDLTPEDDPDASERLARTWFTDVDMDGKIDLVTQHWVTDGSWFGATARISVYRGTGTGFGSAQTIRTDGAAVEVRLTDFDGDGDQDLIVGEIDLGMGNLGRALIARTVQIQANLYRMSDSGRYPTAPQQLRDLSWPLDDPSRLLLSFDGDINGDGRLDLVTNNGAAELSVYFGGLGALPTTPNLQVATDEGRAGEQLFVRDLTGDGRAEIIRWRSGEDAATLWTLK